jgi:hypothetical protein
MVGVRRGRQQAYLKLRVRHLHNDLWTLKLNRGRVRGRFSRKRRNGASSGDSGRCDKIGATMTCNRSRRHAKTWIELQNLHPPVRIWAAPL